MCSAQLSLQVESRGSPWCFGTESIIAPETKFFQFLSERVLCIVAAVEFGVVDPITCFFRVKQVRALLPELFCASRIDLFSLFLHFNIHHVCTNLTVFLLPLCSKVVVQSKQPKMTDVQHSAASLSNSFEKLSVADADSKKEQSQSANASSSSTTADPALNSSSTVVNPEFTIKHPLQNSWSWWYDYPGKKTNQNTWANHLKVIYTFSSVEDFWRFVLTRGILLPTRFLEHVIDHCHFPFLSSRFRFKFPCRATSLRSLSLTRLSHPACSTT